MSPPASCLGQTIPVERTLPPPLTIQRELFAEYTDDMIVVWPYISRPGKGRISLSEVRIAEGESIEAALKRFKKKIQKAGILSEIKRRERYEKPSVKRKRKAEAARKRRT